MVPLPSSGLSFPALLICFPKKRLHPVSTPSVCSLIALVCTQTAGTRRRKSPEPGLQRVEHEVGGGVVSKPGQLTALSQHMPWVTFPHPESDLSQCRSGWPLTLLDTASFAFWCHTMADPALSGPLRCDTSQVASEDVPCPQQ